MEEMKDRRLSLSVVMPALNEEKNILPAVDQTLKAFEKFGIDGEIIAVNDGSRDRTEDLIQDRMRQEPRLRLLRHDRSQGIGASFWDGVKNARGTIVTMFPGDNENDLYEALRYANLLEQVDIVVPFIVNRKARGMARGLLSFFYRTIVNLTFGLNLNYTNGTVMYRRSILGGMELESKGFLYQTEILVKMIRRGYLFAEVPCFLGQRASGVSKAVTFSSFLNVARGYLLLLSAVYGKGSASSGDLTPDSVTFLRARRAEDGKDHS